MHINLDSPDPRHQLARVFCDGHEIKYPLEADDERNWVRFIATNEKGEMITLHDGRLFICELVCKNVEIKLENDLQTVKDKGRVAARFNAGRIKK